MAKQKGIIPLVGTIGGINFYYLNGKAIKTKASMKRVRENAKEFGHCSKVNKAFRAALRPFYAPHKFTFFHSRLMTLFTQLKALDTTHERVRRQVATAVATDEGKRLLLEFNYTPKVDLRQVLPFSMEMDWASYTLSLSDFAIQQVPFITGATHIGLQFGVLDFNFSTLAFELHLAEPMVLAKDFSGTSVSLSPISVPSGVGQSLVVLGVQYYQEVDGRLYVLHAEDGVGFAVVGCK